MKETVNMKRTLTAYFALAGVLAVVSHAHPFTDVSEDAPYADAVAYVYDAGITSGTSPDAFSPYDYLTRGMFVTFLGRAAGVSGEAASHPFEDVAADDFFAPYVAWAYRGGIIRGTDETHFSPDALVSKEQVAVMLDRYAGTYPVPDGDMPGDFTLASDYAKDAVEKLWKTGIITEEDGMFEPYNNATRAETAVMLHHFSAFPKSEDGALVLCANGVTHFTIETSDFTYRRCGSTIESFRRTIEAVGGAAPAVTVSKQSANTVRFEYGGNVCDYLCTVDAKKGIITIKAGSEAAMNEAAAKLLSRACLGAKGCVKVYESDSFAFDHEKDTTDNSAFLHYEGGRYTSLEMSDENGTLMSPAWLKTAVMAEVQLDAHALGGTFMTSTRLIDYYAKTGVNVLWVTPIYERGPFGNGYGNYGVNTLEPSLTGTHDLTEGYAKVRAFTDYAHDKGIYILLDIVTWGTTSDSPLYKEHPAWFGGKAWGGEAFDFSNEEFRAWFVKNAVDVLEKTGADGFRCDCEPFTAGYDVFRAIREEANRRMLFPVIMSEDGDERRGVFDLEQDGAINYSYCTRGGYYEYPVNFFADGISDIVESVKTGENFGSRALQLSGRSGTFRYYVNAVSCHDHQSRSVCGSRVKLGYSAIFAPVIPLWFMGDEAGATGGGILYSQPVNPAKLEGIPANALFAEDVRRMIAIRRSYPDLFEEYPLDHRDSNIMAVPTEGITPLTCYARYTDDRAVIVVPNRDSDTSGVGRITVPKELRKEGGTTVTDLFTGKKITLDEDGAFETYVAYDHVGVYLIESAA